jgi:hypothetical protein
MGVNAMIQRPNAVGLMLCQQVIIEEKTRNRTLVNNFSRLEVKNFPASVPPFSVVSTLTDGMGEMTLTLVVARLDTLEEVYTQAVRTRFDNPLQELRLQFRVTHCSFPVPGRYQFALLADGEDVTACVLTIIAREE